MANNKSRRAQQPAAQTSAVSARKTQHARMDPEDMTRLLLWGGTLAIVLLTAFLVVFGYYWSTVKPRGRTVLQVDNYEVSYSAMKRRMAYEYYGNQNLQNTRSATLVPALAYQNLIDELTAMSSAREELGVDFTPEEYDKAIRAEVGVAADASPAERRHLRDDAVKFLAETTTWPWHDLRGQFVSLGSAWHPHSRAALTSVMTKLASLKV